MSETSPLPPALPPELGDAGTVAPWPPREPSAHRTELPLRGITVVDLTAFWAGPAATHLLAMLGADVVKVESVQRPDGMRFAGGFRADVERWWEYSWVFHGVNAGKRSITLDLESDSGRELLGRLVADADVVIENFTPRVMENFGLGYDVLKGFNERIIEVRMPGFGLDGPWRDRVGFAMTMEQLAGLAWLTGYPDGLPTAPRGACDPLAGVHATFLTVAALEHRRRTGRGQLVEVPMIDVVLNASALQVIEARRLRCGADPPRQPRPRVRGPERLRLRRRRAVDRGQHSARQRLAGTQECSGATGLGSRRRVHRRIRRPDRRPSRRLVRPPTPARHRRRPSRRGRARRSGGGSRPT